MQAIRLSALRNLIQQNKLDAVLISSTSQIIYLTNFSHFSEIEREAFLLVTKTSQYIFTDARYSQAVRTILKNFNLQEISMEQPLTTLLQTIVDEEKIKNLGIEENNVTVREYQKFNKVIKRLKHIELAPLRMSKHHDEIKKIKKACTLGDKAFSFILTKMKLGITEKDLAYELENFIKKNGALLSFAAIVAFGENAAIPHHKTGNRKLKKNEFVLLDFGVKYDDYCSDMTRTIFFGKINKEQKMIYETVRNAQQKAISFIETQQKNNQEIKASDVDEAARDEIIKAGFPSIPHSLGHGIGLQVHESPNLSPRSKHILTEGMVFSIEPGIYLPDRLGVRIEDIFAIQNNKLIQLTTSPRILIEIG